MSNQEANIFPLFFYIQILCNLWIAYIQFFYCSQIKNLIIYTFFFFFAVQVRRYNLVIRWALYTYEIGKPFLLFIYKSYYKPHSIHKFNIFISQESNLFPFYPNSDINILFVEWLLNFFLLCSIHTQPLYIFIVSAQTIIVCNATHHPS